MRDKPGGLDAPVQSSGVLKRMPIGRNLIHCLVLALPLVFASLPVVAAESVEALLRKIEQNLGLDGTMQRFEAQQALTKIAKQNPTAVVAPIVEVLETGLPRDQKSRDYQIALLNVLQGIGKPAEAAVPVLIEIVQDEDPKNEWLRFAAGLVLANIRTPEAEDAGRASAYTIMERWLETASPAEVERSVAQGAFRIRQELRKTNVTDSLIEPMVINLIVTGPRAAAATPELLRAYDDPRLGDELRGLIERALRAVGVEEIAAAAAEARASRRSLDRVQAVIADTRNPDPFINSDAIGELGKLGPSEVVLDALIEALEAGRSPGAVANVLGGFGPAADRAAPYLLPHLNHERASWNVIQALGKIGSRDARIVTALKEIADDESRPDRAMAAAALGELGVVAALPELTGALSADDKYTKILAARSLGDLGAAAAEAVPSLSDLLQDDDMDVRRAAVEALGRIGPSAQTAVPRIAEQLRSSDRRLKDGAVIALGRIGSAEAARALEVDARRYAEADGTEYRRLRDAGELEKIGRYTRGLPAARRVQVARLMTAEPDSRLAAVGSSLLIREGLEEETVPVLARIIASGETGQEAIAGLVWEWLHGADAGLSERMMGRLRDHFAENTTDYSEAERARFRALFGPAETQQ